MTARAFVEQSGRVTPTHAARWVTNGVIADGGAITSVDSILVAGKVVSYETNTSARSSLVPVGTTAVQTFGYYDIGDGGGALYTYFGTTTGVDIPLPFAGWIPGASTVTANAGIAPNGTMTASKLMEDTANSFHGADQTFVKAATSLPYTFTGKYKSTNRNVEVDIYDGGSNGVFYQVDLSTGAVITAAATFGAGFTVVTSSVTAAELGYWEISLSVTSNTTAQINVEINTMSGSSSSYVGDGVSFLLFAEMSLSQSIGIPANTGYFASADGSIWKLAEATANAKMFGCAADGITDDTIPLQYALDFCIPPLTPLSCIPLFIPGNYKITSSLLLTDAFGADIFGINRFSTKITNTANGNVFTTQGCQYSNFSDMLLVTDGAGICFDLDGTANLQNDSFTNMQFSCTSAAAGSIGVRIGFSNFMGSENIFTHCKFNSCEKGLVTANFNALNNITNGCDWQSCQWGVYVESGSVQVYGGTFENIPTNIADIQVDAGADTTMVISGCRSESDNFCIIINQAATIEGCLHAGSNNGIFLQAGAVQQTIIGCDSRLGQISSTNTSLTIINSDFGRGADWVTGNVQAILMNVFTGTNFNSGGTGPNVVHRLEVLEFGSINNIRIIPNAKTPTLLTGASPVATDSSSNNIFHYQLTTDIVLSDPTNALDGNTFTWIFEQDVVGGHTVTFGPSFKWPGGVAPIIGSGSFHFDIITSVFYQGRFFSSSQLDFH